MYETFPDDGVERSYGIIPLRFVKGSVQVLVIQHVSTGEWGFPKGHAEPSDATPLDAAKRELFEETGVLPVNMLFDPHTTFFESSYTNPRTGKEKTVVVWTAEIDDTLEVTIQPEEIMAYRFVDIDTVKEVLSFREDRDHIDKLIPLLVDLRDEKPVHYPQIILFGDSLVASSWRTGGLGQRLAHQYQRRADVLNRGFPGCDISLATELLPRVFSNNGSESSPDLVVIWFGTSEIINWSGRRTFPPWEACDIASFIKTTHPKCEVLLMSPPALLPRPHKVDAGSTAGNTSAGTARSHTQSLAQRARQLKLHFVDIFSAMENAAYDACPQILNDGLLRFSTDGLALTPAGYAVIHETLMKAIAEKVPHMLQERLPMICPPHARIAPSDPSKAFQNIRQFI